MSWQDTKSYHSKTKAQGSHVAHLTHFVASFKCELVRVQSLCPWLLPVGEEGQGFPLPDFTS